MTSKTNGLIGLFANKVLKRMLCGSVVSKDPEQTQRKGQLNYKVYYPT